MLVALLVLALNLRPTATEIGPVMPDLRRDLGMDATVAGLLAALPTVCFAVFGVVTPALARRLGAHRLVVLAVVALCAGGVARAFVTTPVAFIVCSTVALAGLAVGNVIAPSLIRHHFRDRVGFVTALYSLAMSIGVAAAAVVTVPLAQALGGWRQAFVATASGAVAALVPWVVVWRRRPDFRPISARGGGIILRQVARTRLGWSMAIFFGTQSAQAYAIFGWIPSVYMAAGLSQDMAGLMLGIVTGAGIPLAFLLPNYVGRNPRPLALHLVIVASGLIGYLGMLLAPATLPWLWALGMCVGTASFPVILALLALKARTTDGTAALSGFTQGLGYLIALSGPLLAGLLNDLTGGWAATMVWFLVLNVVMAVSGWVAMRRPQLEDELDLPEVSDPD